MPFAGRAACAAESTRVVLYGSHPARFAVAESAAIVLCVASSAGIAAAESVTVVPCGIPSSGNFAAESASVLRYGELSTGPFATNHTSIVVLGFPPIGGNGADSGPVVQAASLTIARQLLRNAGHVIFSASEKS